jgi:competence protein ComEA
VRTDPHRIDKDVMKHRLRQIALTTAALLLLGAAPARDGMAATASAPAASASASVPPARQSDAGASKPAAKAQLVDINSAKRGELKKLPGISDAQATKIIAGRPYGSKAQLVSRKILDDASYESIRRHIVAKQPYDDATKNAAIYTNKKQSP